MTTNRSIALYAGEAFALELKRAVEQAAAAQRTYAVLACVPQNLPGEITSGIVNIVGQCILGLVRDADLPGIVGRDIVALGLPDTDAAGVRVIAHRLQNELTLRSTPLRNTVWESGFACLPEDGLTAEELLNTAVGSARTRRRRLAG